MARKLHLWKRMKLEGRITANNYPEDWKYYTLTFPVARYEHLSWADLVDESEACSRAFYSYPRIMRRAFGNVWRTRKPISVLATLLSNLSYRSNGVLHHEKCQGLNLSRGEAEARNGPPEVRRTA